MTAEQHAAEAFDSEWQRALAALPARPCLSDHHTGAHLQHHRCALNIEELLHYHSRKLPAYLYGPRLLAAGWQLVDRAEHQLAADACFKRLAAMNLPNTPDSSNRKLDAAARLGLHVQALYGLHACQAAEALRRDQELRHQHTVTAAVSALAGLQAACEQILPAQPLLVHQGTQLMQAITAKLVEARLHAEALPYLLFAAHAVECHASLHSTQYLPWRVELYAAAAACFHALLEGGSMPTEVVDAACQHVNHLGAGRATTITEAANDMLAAGLSQLASIARAQALDAVPAPEVMAAIQAAQAQLMLLQVLFEHNAAAGTEPPGPAHSIQLKEILSAVGNTQQQLAASVRILQTGLGAHEHSFGQVELPGSLQPVMAAAAELADALLGLTYSAADAASAAANTQAGTQGAETLELHAVSRCSCMMAMFVSRQRYDTNVWQLTESSTKLLRF